MEPLPPKASFTEILLWWETNKQSLIGKDERVLFDFIKHLKARGEPFYACEVCDELLAHDGAEIAPGFRRKIIEEKSLFLAQTGALETAEDILEEAIRQYGASEELLCRMGRISKDRWRKGGPDASGHLERALSFYSEAEREFGGYYPAINAAALALYAGKNDEAAKFALAAEDRSRSEARDEGWNYWSLATCAEARLIRRDEAEAIALYAQAVAAAGNDYTRTATTLAQACEISKVNGADFAAIRRVFPIVNVAICTGHRIDAPSRAVPRFPADRAAAVAEAIRTWMDANDVRIGYCSAASGTDLLFAEALLVRGADCHIVLPFLTESFREVSVADSENGAWYERFDHVMNRATSVTVATNQPYAPEILGFSTFNFADEILLGLACTKAAMMIGDVRGVAVWDGKEGDGEGGRGACLAAWGRRGVDYTVIDPLSAGHREPSISSLSEGFPSASASVCESDADGCQQICAILFADAVGYSKILETDIPGYLKNFREPLLSIVEEFRDDVLEVNTWGDAYFIVLRNVREAGLLALRFQDHISRMEWRPGSGRALRLRTSLHAGPLFRVLDPVTGKHFYTGSHVSVAARIEPQTPEGQIYASEIFAALCAAHDIRDFRLEYVGRRQLPKSFGSSRLFQIFPK